MGQRNWILLAVAVALGLFAVIVANAWFSGVEDRQERTAEQQQMTRIVVASQPLDFGSQLSEQNLRLQTWPAGSVPEGAFRTLPEALKNNRVALRPIVPGEPVLASKVSGTDGRATLAAVLPAGMRAKSIAISAVSGVSGFVLPGTMVDVILTRKIPGDGATSEDYRSDVVLHNVQVLAIDQGASDREDKPKVGKTATLAVSLFDAQRLDIAERIGALSLVLRKIEDAADAPANSNDTLAARTVTNRQLGGRRFIIPARGVNQPGLPSFGGGAMLPPGMAGPPAISGPSMTVVRGVEPTTYPVGKLGR